MTYKEMKKQGTDTSVSLTEGVMLAICIGAGTALLYAIAVIWG